MDDTELQTDILVSINPEDHTKEDEIEKQQNEQTNSEINAKDNWTEKDVEFLKSIGVENVPLTDDANVDIGKLEFRHRMPMIKRRKKRLMAHMKTKQVDCIFFL